MSAVTEIGFFYVKPGDEDAFAAAAGQAKRFIEASDGCRGARLRQGVETPTTFVLTVEWDSLESHQAFRASDRLPKWRGPIAGFFAKDPFVEHYAVRG